MIDNEKVIYPELSYRIVGIAYEVYNELGYGMQEKHYQRAFEVSLKEKDVLFESQKCVELSYKNESIGRYFLDLIVDDKIIYNGQDFPRAEINGMDMIQHNGKWVEAGDDNLPWESDANAF